MEPVETYERNGCTVTIEYDQDAENPTSDGWFKIIRDPTDHVTVSGKLTPALQAKLKAGKAFWFDVYEHGGCSYTLAGEGMNDRWDTTSYAGFIELTEVDKSQNYETRQKIARECLETYTAWANGDVYGFVVTDDAGEVVDSCWGFIGDMEYCKAEANAAADAYQIPRRNNPASRVHV